MAGCVVGDRLRDAEHDDKGQDRGARDKMKLLLGDRGQDAALHPHHRADEGVHQHEQPELSEVLA